MRNPKQHDDATMGSTGLTKQTEDRVFPFLGLLVKGPRV